MSDETKRSGIIGSSYQLNSLDMPSLVSWDFFIHNVVSTRLFIKTIAIIVCKAWALAWIAWEKKDNILVRNRIGTRVVIVGQVCVKGGRKPLMGIRPKTQFGHT